MIVSLPSRPTSPMRAQTLLVPTSMPTRTAARATVLFVCVRSAGLEEVPPDESHVVEDPQAEGDERHQVQVETEPIADECQEDGDDRIDHEAADEDAIVIDAVELRADGPEHRIERGEDGHGRVSTELEADVDIEDEPCKDAHEEPEQG